MRSLILILPLLPLVSGCGGCDTAGQQAIEYNGGNTSLEGLSYETARVGGEFLHFPAGRRYDLMHGLGITPDLVSSYISFERVPGQDNGGGDDAEDATSSAVAEAAGNMVVIECQDPERVRVRNDTCAEFYLRVVIKAQANLSQGEQPCNDQ